MPKTPKKGKVQLSNSKAREFSLVDKFPLSYRNREDVTNLPPGVMIEGSQNVFTNVSERIQIRKGYKLDGQFSSVASPVSSSYDWLTRNNGEKHLRVGGQTVAGITANLVVNGDFDGNANNWVLPAGWAYGTDNIIHTPGNSDPATQSGFSFVIDRTYRLTYTISDYTDGTIFPQVSSNGLTSRSADGTYTENINLTGSLVQTLIFVPSSDFDGSISNVSLFLLGDGLLQYRYVDDDGEVDWIDLMTQLTSVDFNFTTFWRTDENLRVCLFVDGSSNIYEWNGAVTTLASTTSNTITKNGTDTWNDAGFYTTGDKKLVINDTEYTYTGGEGTITLTGVTPDPSGEIVDSVIHQQVITTANSSFTDGPPATFANALISVLNNQIFLAALNSSAVWISNVNSYTDYGSSTPRQSGEGATLILDSQIVAFKPQEQFMYVSAGQDLWYNVNFEIQTSTVGVTYEQVNALPLKTGKQQGALSQAFVSHMKNNILLVTNEPTIDTFGRIESSLATPQQVNLSDSIKLDVDAYDFTDGCIFYFQYNIYVAVPKEGIVLIYSLATNSWEAPQTLPISRFYIVDGELYGHSYNTFESYKLFDGFADRVHDDFTGYPIAVKAIFSYQNFGTRSAMKHANAFYIEGYISPNTTLNCAITYELDGCKVVRTFQVNGSDSSIVCIPQSGGPLGKTSLGKIKLGGDKIDSFQNLPPKFRVEKIFSNTNFFECSFSFEIIGINQVFQLLAFGLNVGIAPEEKTSIRQP